MKTFSYAITACVLVLMFSQLTFAQKSADDYLRLSQERLDKRDVKGAIDALSKAIELKPDNAKSYAQRSRLQMITGQPDLALADLDKALLIDPELAQAYADRSRIRMLKNDMTGALADLDNAIGRGQRSDEIYASRAHLRMMTRDFPGAIDDFTIAMTMNPKRSGYHVARAGARRMSGDEAGAVADYSVVLEQFEQEEAERLKAGKQPRTATPFDLQSPMIKGAESRQKNATSMSGVVVSMRSDANGMTPEQMEYLPNIAGAYTNRGLIYQKRGDAAAAMADFNKSIVVDPANSWARYTRGKALLDSGDPTAALADFDEAVKSGAPLAIIYVERGATLTLLGRDAEAEADFAQAVKMDPRMESLVERKRVEAKQKAEKKTP
jgi:tetratricopeptide (TPR) repeat protein